MLLEKPGTVYWILADIHEKTEINELHVSDHKGMLWCYGQTGQMPVRFRETTAALPHQNTIL